MMGIFGVQAVLLAKLGRDHRADLLEHDGNMMGRSASSSGA